MSVDQTCVNGRRRGTCMHRCTEICIYIYLRVYICKRVYIYVSCPRALSAPSFCTLVGGQFRISAEGARRDGEKKMEGKRRRLGWWFVFVVIVCGERQQQRVAREQYCRGRCVRVGGRGDRGRFRTSIILLLDPLLVFVVLVLVLVLVVLVLLRRVRRIQRRSSFPAARSTAGARTGSSAADTDTAAIRPAPPACEGATTVSR